MKKIYIFIILLITVAFGSLLMIPGCGKKGADESGMMDENINYYTCGMHPSVKVSPEEYDKGNKSCPICNMNLTPVYKEKKEEGVYYGCGMEGAEHVFFIKDVKGMTTCPICGMPLKELSKEEAEKLKGVVSKVKIEGRQIALAGVQTEPVRKLHLYKEIRTVGRVAYDPELVIAQEEFISALKTLDRVEEGSIAEIKERSKNLVGSSKRRLRLLGLSEDQIAQLEKEKKVETSLILPEDEMWIYGDVYEYELGWVRVGEKVLVSASSLPGEEFKGVIASVNPVLDPKTRSLRFRAKVENPGLKLKPEMYVDIVIVSMYMGSEGEHEILALPKDSVLDTGVRKIVWIDKGSGEYEGRIVEIGPEATGEVEGNKVIFYPVLKGLVEGEMVVTRANFLIDSQSQISGVTASSYGGALEGEGKSTPKLHQH